MKFLNRLIVSMIFAPVTLLMFYLGGVYMFSFLGILVILMLHELRVNYRKKGIHIPVTMLFFGIMVYIAGALGEDYLVMSVLFVGILVMSGNYLFRNKPEASIQKLSIAMLSIIYTAYFLALLFRLRVLPQGRSLVTALLLVIWVTDTSAYITGMLIGKRKGIIKISPHKSLEGFLGGFIFSLIGSYTLVLFLKLNVNYIWMLSISGGIVGQYGDLFESMIKRDLQIKDSSRILQEHGGILDRFDSLLFATPALYIILKLTGVF